MIELNNHYRKASKKKAPLTCHPMINKYDNSSISGFLAVLSDLSKAKKTISRQDRIVHVRIWYTHELC